MKRLSTCSLSVAVKAAATVLLSVAGLLLVGVQSVQALPSFARQTGQQCVACHNGFPELTPYGRQFKLNGYTFSDSSAPAIPLAALLIDSYSHTDKKLAAPLIPDTSTNNNPEMDVAVFYAGKIASNIGAYIEGAYSTLGHGFSLFNTDLRYANTAHLFGKDATFGVAINNDPGLTDPWNTAQSFWNYPYEVSHFATQPAASTALQGRYSRQIIGENAYVSWNRWLYAGVGLYQSIDTGTLNSLGINTRSLSPIKGAAPYWRLAVEPAWGHSTLEFGTFGMALSSDPHMITTAGTDRTVDVGVDTEYQYLADRHSVSFMASYIDEHSTLSASRALGFSSNARENLHTLNLKGTYFYDQTYGANLGYFQTAGSHDLTLYGGAGAANGSPNSSAWTGELNYYPFNRGGPAFWRELGLKLGLQYTYYTRFDGGGSNYDGLGRSASANNTLFLYSWTAF